VPIGIDSFAAAYDDASLAVSASDRLRNLVEQIEHADQVRLDVFAIGEHHRREYLDSAPAVILAAAGARTRHIRLTNAVTVLSSADPVREIPDGDRTLFLLHEVHGLGSQKFRIPLQRCAFSCRSANHLEVFS
jgi:Luciferase-like monooxygenase